RRIEAGGSPRHRRIAAHRQARGIGRVDILARDIGQLDDLLDRVDFDKADYRIDRRDDVVRAARDRRSGPRRTQGQLRAALNRGYRERYLRRPDMQEDLSIRLLSKGSADSGYDRGASRDANRACGLDRDSVENVISEKKRPRPRFDFFALRLIEQRPEVRVQ